MTTAPFFKEGRFRFERATVRTNAELLEAWKAEVDKQYQGKTVTRYKEVAERFIEFLDERGIRFQDLPPQLLGDYLASRLAKCCALGRVNKGFLCKEDIFELQPVVPAVCGLDCNSYKPIKVDSYLTSEHALERFFEFAATKTTLGAPSIFSEVKDAIHESFQRRHLREAEDARYPRRSLTDEEIAALFHTSRHPRDRLVIGFMIKTGARQQEALLLPDGPDIRAYWKAERIITIKFQPGIKRLGNPYLIIDDQLWELFLDYYEWKDRALAKVKEDDLAVAVSSLEKTASIAS